MTRQAIRDRLADLFARGDRKRHIAACECSAYGGKLVHEPAHPARRPSFYAAERCCSGPGWQGVREAAAYFEAMVSTARAIELLPVIEPRRTLAP